MKKTISLTLALFVIFTMITAGCDNGSGIAPSPEPEATKIIITFNGNGGSLAAGSVQIFEGYPLPTEYITGNKIPTRTDYRFTGWKDAAETVITALKTFNQNTTLYAQWEELKDFTITFDTDGGDRVIPDVTVKEGSFLPAEYFGIGNKAPKKDGNRFNDWKDGTTTVNRLTKITRNMNLIAQWVWQVRVRFDLGVDDEDGSIINPGEPPYSVTIDNNAALGNSYPRNDPEWESKDPKFLYRFIGWYNDTDIYARTTLISVVPPDAVFLLTAKWTKEFVENAQSPAIHPGNHFQEIVDGGELTISVNEEFKADGLYSNIEKGAGVLSAKWYRTTTKTEADAATADEPKGDVIITQTAEGTAMPYELSLPFTWQEDTPGTYWYYVVVTNYNEYATVKTTSSSITQNRLKVTVTEE